MPSETVSALQQAVEGLTYESETDSPWTVFSWPKATGVPTGEGVRKQGRHKANAPVEEKTIEEFFAPLTQNQDWYRDEEKATAAKYRSLLSVIKQRLTNPKVVRVGGRKVAVYVVGQAAEDGWAGLKTTAVET
ncbi:MAG TPA: nuclease A inhibitor family protein [Gemmataceae bacterium]|nr:nuclease A inhibitor family protein [Gemmataceae bacterium]